MDSSFVQGEQKFHYRVCAVMIAGERILAMRDERAPYFYLPGGRVQMGRRRSRRWCGKSGRSWA